MRNLLLALVVLIGLHASTGFHVSPLLARYHGALRNVRNVSPQRLPFLPAMLRSRVAVGVVRPTMNMEGGDNAMAKTVVGEEERVSLWQEIQRAELRMKLAAETEQFDEAAALRDSLRDLRLRDPYVRAEEDLKKAVEEERYEDAAELQQVLKDVGRPPDSQMNKALATLAGIVEEESSRAKGFSDMTTNGIRVRVESFFIPDQSSPTDGRFLFGYNVTVTNLGKKPVQLIARTWLIRTEPSNLAEEVSGSGVVGRQPVLEQGETFRYASACPLNVGVEFLGDLPASRVLGSMEGSYTMVSGALGQDSFKAKIEPFSFILPSDVALPA